MRCKGPVALFNAVARPFAFAKNPKSTERALCWLSCMTEGRLYPPAAHEAKRDPLTDAANAGTTIRGSDGVCSSDGNGTEFFCYFLHRHLSFRHAEIAALASMEGCTCLAWRRPAGGSFFSPFWYVQLPSEVAARRIAARSMLVKGFYELWGEGGSFEELEAALLPAGIAQGAAADERSWKIVVDTWGKTMKLQDQITLINRLAFLNFKGPISLGQADVVYRLIITSDETRNGLPENTTPVRYYFGREVAVSNRRVISRYALPQRLFIGPTSMDTEMAFVICNMAKICSGDLVYDPFVGTGSLLVAATHLGAKTLGADIDVRVVRDGKLGSDGQVCDIWANFRQYGLSPPAGLLRLDAHVPAFRTAATGWLDAIVTDPPYGVRAGGRRSLCLSERGTLSETGRRRAEMEAAGEWYPPTQSYGLVECLGDLLGLAARHLRVGGRLAYFLPAAPGSCEGADVPRHPALRLVSNCEQVLTRRYSRRLITMEKHKAFDASEPVAPIDPDIEARLARLHEVVYEARPEPPRKQKYRGKQC